MPIITPLPLDDSWPQLELALQMHRNLVLVAEPGAGKTTRFPPALLRSGLLGDRKKVLMLEPRRLAARAAAARIAEEQGWKLGEEVGYQVRFDSRISSRTRLQVLTEGLLSRRLQSDPELSEFGAVLLDEFHERSLHTDLAIGLLSEMQQLARPDLRIVVMSATLDAERVSEFLDHAPIVRVPGRTYPIEIHYSRNPLAIETGEIFLDRVSAAIEGAVDGSQTSLGDLLVFLPGSREIRGVAERMARKASRFGAECVELHGSLTLEDQDRAIRKRPGVRKIVLATNIAETSLTIDGVGTVIDSGLARTMRTDSLGFPRLSLSRISLASATQRAGRSGRQGPGHCYRLWSKLDEASFQEFESPEILRSDLSETALFLLAQGVSDPSAFSWFEKPEASALKNALSTLTDLGFRDAKSGLLTPDGKEALKLPLPPRPARLLLESAKIGQVALGAKLAALLTEKDIVFGRPDLKRQATLESDLIIRLHLLESRTQVDRFSAQNVTRVASALEMAASRLEFKKTQDWSKGLSIDETAQRLLLLGFPDRVAKRRRAKEKAARMVGGKGVQLAPFSVVETAELFLALNSYEPAARGANTGRGDAQISIASRIEPEWLEQFFPLAISKGNRIVFDGESQSVQKQTADFYHDLAIGNVHISRPTADEAFDLLISECESRWETLFAPNEDIASITTRIEFLKRELAIELDLTQAKRGFLEEICFGQTKISAISQGALGEIFLRHLPDAIRALLRDEAPDSLQVPSGSRIRLQYPLERSPFIEVRIQEIFGWTASPLIARGRVSVQLHLLGPNFRPVQVTSDLNSFWRSGYVEVRKELRSRYPKHSWPDDPLSAKPEAKGRRRT
jgi:ATP-dependent helicase HrpB